MAAKQIYEVRINAISEEYTVYQVVANTSQEAQELAKAHAQADWDRWITVTRDIKNLEIDGDYVMETDHKDGAVF